MNFKPSKDTLLYLSWSNGYKAGGFNGIAATRLAARTPFAPEKASSFEGGAKMEMLDKRVRLNVATFYTDYTDLQNFSFDAGSAMTVTADAEIYGFEAVLTAQMTSNLRADVSYGYLHTKYTSFPDDISNVGNRLMRSPRSSGAASVTYDQDISDNLYLTAIIDMTFQSKQYFSVGNDELNADNGHAVLGAQIQVQHENGWRISLYGQNLTNKKYTVHSAGPIFGMAFPVYSQPFRWGLSVRYDF